MVHYTIISEHFKSEEATYTSYGIASPDGTVIHDITTDGISLARFTDKLNRLELSPVHLHDAVEDFLAELPEDFVRCTMLFPTGKALKQSV